MEEKREKNIWIKKKCEIHFYFLKITPHFVSFILKQRVKDFKEKKRKEKKKKKRNHLENEKVGGFVTVKKTILNNSGSVGIVPLGFWKNNGCCCFSSSPSGTHSRNPVMASSEASNAIQVRFQGLVFPHFPPFIHQIAPSKATQEHPCPVNFR